MIGGMRGIERCIPLFDPMASDFFFDFFFETRRD